MSLKPPSGLPQSLMSYNHACMFIRILLFQRRQPVAFAVMLSAICCTLFVVLLPHLLITRPDSAGNLASLLRWYLPGYVLAWLSLTLLMVTLRHRMVMPTVKQNVILILSVALILRLFAVFATTPQLSDDIWRYIHDGHTLATGDNPYRIAPADLPLQNDVTRRINHPQLVTIYQPTSQWIFAALAILQFDPLGDVTYRLGFVLFDLAIIAMLMALLHQRRRSIWWAIVYAWHPLVLSEVAATGHQDVIGIAMLLACMGFVLRRQRRLDMLFAGSCFAMAVAVKPIVFPLVLPLIWELFKNPVACSLDHRVMCSKAALVHALFGAVLTGIALYWPFTQMPGGIDQLWFTASTFVKHWQFNSLIHGIAMHFTHDPRQARWMAGGLLMFVLLSAMRKRVGLIETCCIYLFTAMLCSSTVYPWYLLWALAFLPLCFSWGLWTLSLTIIFGYEVLAHQDQWPVPLWIWALTWLPVIGGVYGDLVIATRTSDKTSS